MVTVPILLFIVFYGIINVNTLLLAFKKYEYADGNGLGYKVSFAGLENFAVVIKMLAYNGNWQMIINSVTLWAFRLVVGLSVSVIFSYYVYKRVIGSGFFRVILFLPNVISNLIMVYLFKFLVNNAMTKVFGIQGLLVNPNTQFATVMFFNLWLGFAGQTLMLTSSMASINESIVESAQIDGVTSLKELFYITIPMIFPTLSTLMVISLAEMFVDQMSLVTFYDIYSIPPKIRTIGYYLYVQALESDVITDKPWLTNPDHGELSYPQLSAFGVMVSAVIIPLSFGARRLLAAISPSED
jgi:ABC-type sugar transport system permease subunit